MYNRLGSALTTDDLDKMFVFGNKVLVLGDFNAKNTEWNFNRNTEGRKLKNYCDDSNVVLHFLDKPTHFPDITRNQPSMLDILLNKNSNIIHSKVFNKLQSDHRPVAFGVLMTNYYKKVIKPIKIFSAADW